MRREYSARRGFGRAAWIAMLLLVALAAASCGGKPPEATPTPAEAAGQVAKPTVAPTVPLPAATPRAPTPPPQPPAPTPTPPSPEPTPTLEELPTPQAFSDWWNALEGVQTYRGRTSFQGSDGTSFVAELERVKEPPAARTVLHSVDEEGNVSDVELIQVNDELYLRTKEGDTWSEWMAMKVGEGEEALSPSDAFSAPFQGLSGWKASDLDVVDRHETVNGVDTTHYRASDTLMAQYIRAANVPGEGEQPEEKILYTKAEADFWVANQGGYLVKSTVHIEGTEEGKPFTWDLSTEVLEVNKPLKIEAPAGVAKPGLPEDIPIFPGAKLVSSIQGMSAFQTSASVKEVGDFYKKELPARGWTLQEGSMETEDTAMYTFSKGERSCQLMITREGETTSFTILCQ